MDKLFSERQGHVQLVSLNPQEVTIALRNRIWNTFKQHLDSSYNTRRNQMILYIWDLFFKEDVDLLRFTPSRSGKYYYVEQIKEKFYKLEWYLVYDFLEFALNITNPESVNFASAVNFVFLYERVPYKIIDNKVTPLITGEEAEEVERAANSKYDGVSKHIKKALEFYCKRPDADYQNSIKESISAIEALAKIALNQPKATLGELAGQLDIHPAFQKAIKALYGWTSDASGVRHADHGQGLLVAESEARYMLVQCSALVNYIISKEKP